MEMMMARLSNSTRESMAAALVRHRFADEAARLIAESQELFRLAYDHHHAADTQRHMAAIEKKHAKAFARRSVMSLNVAGRRFDVGAVRIGIEAVAWKVEVAARPMLSDAGREYLGMDAALPLAIRAVQWSDDVLTLKGLLETARREALGALGQFSTGKKLAAEWPEAMPVIGALIPEDDRTLPVVQVAGLNAKFGLPPSGSAATVARKLAA